MADTIRIDLTYVRALNGQVSGTAGRLRGEVDNVENKITSDSKVDDKLHDFMKKWDKRRGQVADSLDAVAQALSAIDKSFSETDHKMAGQLTDGCS